MPFSKVISGKSNSPYEMITQEEGMQDGQSDWTSDQTNKKIEKLTFGQIFITTVTTSSIWISKFLGIFFLQMACFNMAIQVVGIFEYFGTVLTGTGSTGVNQNHMALHVVLNPGGFSTKLAFRDNLTRRKVNIINQKSHHILLWSCNVWLHFRFWAFKWGKLFRYCLLSEWSKLLAAVS